MGVPSGSSHADHERVLIQRDYVRGYDDNLRVPVWTAHRLAPDDFKKRSRTECFHNDQRLPDAVAAFCTDYDEPIFDRGHLVPNLAMTMSQQSMINTYMFSNMTPQHCAFNRGIWQVFEGLVRGWVASQGTLYIITGSVLSAHPLCSWSPRPPQHLSVDAIYRNMAPNNTSHWGARGAVARIQTLAGARAGGRER